VRELQEELALPLNPVGPGGAGVAASEPPLYYTLETIPYYLGSAGTLLDRLELMRLLSALMAGLTALFTFLFVRELLPGAPWAWIVGGLGAALAPLLGFTSGGVTPDAMLFAVSAAIFFCVARAFRRGLTRKRAVAIGLLMAVGFLTKLNFIGLAPGLMLGLVVLAFRGVPASPGTDEHRRAFAAMALAMAIAVSPVCVYVLSNALAHRHLLGIVSSTNNSPGHGESLLDDIAYIWQFYLPRLPGMVNDFPGLSTIRQTWFDRSVGLYGWLDTSFPVWVDNLALIPTGLIAILGLRKLIARRAALRAHVSEILVYLAMSVGLMVLIGQDSYVNRAVEGAGWAQPRYLMPLLPLAAAFLALAARGAGRRWGPPVGALIVVLFFAQDIFSQLLVVARFYT
jgi:4-amino-4-deoxy-L-arabinose transferase-like glycosyltransferase